MMRTIPPFLAAAATGLFVAGCGGSTVVRTVTVAVTAPTTPAALVTSTATPSTTAEPSPSSTSAIAGVNPGPRVEGRWTIVYTPKNYAGEVDRARWRVTAQCDVGACSFRAKRNDGGIRNFRFSPSIGDYTLERRGFENCVYEDGRVATKKGYRWTAQTVLRVKASETREGVLVATKLAGRSVTRY
jgi:hypothetical protein